MPRVIIPGTPSTRPVPLPNVASTRVIMRQLLSTGRYDTYEFPFAPREVSFEELSGDIVEIARAGRYPHTEYRAPKLQKVSFEFRVADRDTGGIAPIDEQLLKLRQMSLRDAVVQISGLDDLVTYSNRSEGIRYDAAWYRITNFAFRSVQRAISGSSTNGNHKIAIADCALSLVENRNDQLPVITVPRIFYPVDIPVASGGDPGGVPGTDNPQFNNYA